ncbi:MotA/TolQ/ExbB proton channel family protein, partial [Lysobacter sp. 2RAB21]
VVGMIQMFMVINDHGIGDVNQLAGGIGKALVCTATGMIVAIPALIAHRWFRGRVAEYIVAMEHEAIALIDVLTPGTAESRQTEAARAPVRLAGGQAG